MDEKFIIDDSSDDRKYFTLVPNYILNHSTAIDQALYLQMKRFAGDSGVCWASQATLIKLLNNGSGKRRKISKVALKQSLDYLLEHRWVELAGKRKIKTRGGEQEVNVYRVNNIWKLNVDYYEQKGGSQTLPFNERGDSGISKGGFQNTSNKNQVNKNQSNTQKINDTQEQSEPKTEKVHISESQIRSVINAFKPVNLNYDKWFSNTTERKACSELIEKYTYQLVLDTIEVLPVVNKLAWMPTITKPTKLLDKWADLMAGIAKKKNEQESKLEGKSRGFLI